MVYEYYCEDCKKTIEVEQKITESNLKECPECKCENFKRQISNTSFILKGTGWFNSGGY
jgi:putative FmdB family regulatory protein